MKKKIVRLQSDNYQVFIDPGDPITKCFVQYSYGEEMTVKMFGISVRKANDPYDYETGNRMALKSALANLTPEHRDEIWQAYFRLFPIATRKTEEQKLADYGRHLIRVIEARGFSALNEIPMCLIERCMEAVIAQEERDHRRAKLEARIKQEQEIFKLALEEVLS